jgi:hypothetical protein
LTVVLDLLELLIAAVAAFARLLTSVLSGEGEVRGHGFVVHRFSSVPTPRGEIEPVVGTGATALSIVT